MSDRGLAERIAKWKSFEMDSGHVVLHFVNTLDWRGTERQHEWLKEPADLPAWAERVGLLTAKELETAHRDAAGSPTQAVRAFAEGLELRETLYRILRAATEGKPPRADDWTRFDAAFRRAMSQMRCAMQAPTEQGGRPSYRLMFHADTGAGRRILHTLAKEAADLLSSPSLARVKRCQGEDCGWLFLDLTKNGSRKWCSMESCGNRAKAQRHYRKLKAGG